MYQRILVPFDGSDTSTRGLEEAIGLARLTQGHLRVFHVIDEMSFALAMDAYAGYRGDWLNTLRDQGAAMLAAAQAKAQAAGVQAETVLRDRFNTRVADLVASEATTWPADLIVVGTHGRRGIGRLVLGSAAEHILRIAPVPVLLVRAPENVEPAATDDAPASIRVSLPSAALSIE
ncbi:MAG TPA: universal stress protein [Ramlibacter sp.]|nr:universal stress protein [Ramlibacter sp.]